MVYVECTTFQNTNNRSEIAQKRNYWFPNERLTGFEATTQNKRMFEIGCEMRIPL